MPTVAIENGLTSADDIRSGIQCAWELLETVLSATGEDIDVLANQFQGLAGDVQCVIELTSGIVACVQEDWVQSIVPMVRRLGEAASCFIEQRVRSLSAISVVFGNEAEMLENLSALTTEQRSIAREGKTMAVLASIEVARLGAAGGSFEYMARELNEFSTTVSWGAEEVRDHAQERRSNLLARRRKLHLTLQRRKEHFTIVQSELGEAIASVTSALAELARVPGDFRDCVAVTGDNISRIVEAVQMQDVTRQQTEHVRDSLREDLDAVTASESEENKNPSLRAAMLHLQARQVESAGTTMEDWITQVNTCLESILQVGSSQVVAIGEKILEQQRGLSTQLSRIERLMCECRADDAEIDLSMAGAGALMQIAKTHLERSMHARDQMRLLNFNSMIEARHLGSRATTILEITRNIGRISTRWSSLTNRSGDALESILSSSAEAQQAHRTMTRAGIENLEEACQDSQRGLVALTNAASCARSSGEKIETAVAALHNKIAIVRRIADSLAQSVALLQKAGSKIDHLSQIWGYGASPLTQADRHQIENQCAAVYTCECERQILRSEIFGEAMPLASATGTGNNVELF